MLQRILCVSVLVFFTASCQQGPFIGAMLSSPFNIEKVRLDKGETLTQDFTCPAPPPAEIDLAFTRFYTDKYSSEIDAQAYAAYKAAYAPLKAYENEIIGWANQYARSNPPSLSHAACTLEWLDAWAAEGVLLGETTKNGEYVRKWALASVASAYAQIKDEQSLGFRKKRSVERWLRKVGKTVIKDYSTDTHNRSRQNNHLYWAGWALAITGVAIENKNFFDWGMEKARFGLDQIEEDGTLPLELERKSKALSYHIFAAMPLVMLAETAAVNDIDLYSYNDDALHRLIKRSLRSLDDPAYIADIAGVRQDMDNITTRTHMAWLPVYAARFPGREEKKITELRAQIQPFKLSRIGGNTTLLFSK